MPQQLARERCAQDRRFDLQCSARPKARAVCSIAKTPRSTAFRLFGQGHEISCAQLPQSGMVPAQQGFETGDSAILQPDDRPKNTLIFTRDQSAAQIASRGGAVGALGAHRRGEKFGAIAASLLRVDHGDLGVLRSSLPLARNCRSNSAMPIVRSRHLPFAEADRGRQIGADR